MMRSVKELEEKYGIFVIINNYMARDIDKVSTKCICGHTARQHYGKGTSGGCRGCGHDKMQFRNFCHNFYPTDYILGPEPDLVKPKKKAWWKLW